MKKTLVALSILAAASAQAGIEVYNQDGVTVNLAGDIEVLYIKGKADGSETRQEIQDADFGFDVRYAMNDEFSFGGYWEFDGADSSVTNGTDTFARVGDTYVALYSNSYGSLKVGRLATQLDDAGIGSDFQFGISSFFSNGSPFSGDEAVRYDYDNGSFYAGLGLIQDKHNQGKIGKDGSYTDVKLGYRVADFDFTALAGTASLKNTSHAKLSVETDETLYALEVRYAGVENLNLELGYYGMKSEPKGGKSTTDNTLGFAADYTIDKLVLAAGISQEKYDEEQTKGTAKFDKVTAWFVNAGYGIAPNTTAYVEVGADNGYNDAGAKNGTGVAVGVKASF